MRFHEWRRVSQDPEVPNHIFTKDSRKLTHFTSLCGVDFTTLSLSLQSDRFCLYCKEKLETAEVEAEQDGAEIEKAINFKRYLGDGVYVDIWQDGLVLTTEGGSQDQTIYLEGSVVQGLTEYITYLTNTQLGSKQ